MPQQQGPYGQGGKGKKNWAVLSVHSFKRGKFLRLRRSWQVRGMLMIRDPPFKFRPLCLEGLTGIATEKHTYRVVYFGGRRTLCRARAEGRGPAWPCGTPTVTMIAPDDAEMSPALAQGRSRSDGGSSDRVDPSRGRRE